MLHVRLQAPDFGGPSLNLKAVEQGLSYFAQTAVGHIRGNGGTIVHCSGETAIGLWKTRSPLDAIHCAVAIQSDKALKTVMAIQCGKFLIGNLGDERSRYFNVVGPLQATLQVWSAGAGSP